MSVGQATFDLLKDGSAVDHKYRYTDKIGDHAISKIHQRKYVIDSLCMDRSDWPALQAAVSLIDCSSHKPCKQPFCPMCRHKRQAKFSDQMQLAFGHVSSDQLKFITILNSVHYDASSIDLVLINRLKKQLRNLVNYLQLCSSSDLRFLGAFEIESFAASSITTPNKIAALDALGRDKSSNSPFFLLHFHAVIDLSSLSIAQLRRALTASRFPNPYQVRIQQLHAEKSVKENLDQLARYMLKFRLQHSDRLKFDDDQDQQYQRSSYTRLYDQEIAKAIVMSVRSCNNFQGLIFKSM